MLVNENLKSELVKWSENHKGEKSKLIAQIAASFDDPEMRSRWSLIDIRREVESRSDSRDLKGFSAILDVLHTISYLAPIGFTWYHLSQALRAFRLASDSSNFISFWTGEYSGMKLQTVGIWVLGILAIPFLLHSLLNVLETRRLRTAASLNDLILQTQLEFSTARTITPEALADALSDSATKLDASLKQMEKAVNSTMGTITAITESAETLKEATKDSSDKLSTSSSNLETQIKKLESSFEKIGEVVGQLGSIGTDIATAGETIKKINGLANAATEVKTAIDGALGSAQTAATTIGAFSSSLKDDIKDLGTEFTAQVDSTNQLLNDLVKKISPLISNLKDLAYATDENKPAILYLGEVVKEIKTLAEEISGFTSELVSSANSRSEKNWDSTDE